MILIFLLKGYRADGWLGIILGSRIFVDFTKLDFNAAMNELNRNLDLVLNKNDSVPFKPDQTTNINVSSTENTTEPIHNLIGNLTNKPHVVKKEPPEVLWTEAQVEVWLGEKNINQTIVENLVPCNGQGLLIFWNILDFYRVCAHKLYIFF